MMYIPESEAVKFGSPRPERIRQVASDISKAQGAVHAMIADLLKELDLTETVPIPNLAAMGSQALPTGVMMARPGFLERTARMDSPGRDAFQQIKETDLAFQLAHKSNGQLHPSAPEQQEIACLGQLEAAKLLIEDLNAKVAMQLRDTRAKAASVLHGTIDHVLRSSKGKLNVTPQSAVDTIVELAASIRATGKKPTEADLKQLKTMVKNFLHSTASDESQKQVTTFEKATDRNDFNTKFLRDSTVTRHLTSLLKKTQKGDMLQALQASSVSLFKHELTTAIGSGSPREIARVCDRFAQTLLAEYRDKGIEVPDIDCKLSNELITQLCTVFVCTADDIERARNREDLAQAERRMQMIRTKLMPTSMALIVATIMITLFVVSPDRFIPKPKKAKASAKEVADNDTPQLTPTLASSADPRIAMFHEAPGVEAAAHLPYQEFRKKPLHEYKRTEIILGQSEDGRIELFHPSYFEGMNKEEELSKQNLVEPERRALQVLSFGSKDYRMFVCNAYGTVIYFAPIRVQDRFGNIITDRYHIRIHNPQTQREVIFKVGANHRTPNIYDLYSPSIGKIVRTLTPQRSPSRDRSHEVFEAVLPVLLEAVDGMLKE